MGENLSQVPELRAGQDVILPIETPIKETGHIQILYGNLAPEGSVAKITGEQGALSFLGVSKRRLVCALDAQATREQQRRQSTPPGRQSTRAAAPRLAAWPAERKQRRDVLRVTTGALLPLPVCVPVNRQGGPQVQGRGAGV